MIRVLIVDDDPFIRESLKMMLEIDPKISVCAVCEDGETASAYVKEKGNVDVVLMDIRMPKCDGVEGTRRIKTHSPAVAVLILTTFDDDDYILEAIRYGAGGYLLKSIAPERIIEGIKTVHRGDLLIHPSIAKKLVSFLGHVNPIHPVANVSEPEMTPWQRYGLTETELKVLVQIAEGKSNKEIAQHLYFSEGTVKNYVTEILSKLNLRDRTQLAIYYWKRQTKL